MEQENYMTPSALESGLAKLRECADKTMFADVTHEEAAALLARLAELEWQPIETAPKDGREFQAWLWNEPARTGWWGPRCRYSPDGAFQVWQRVDYDDDGWDVVEEPPTHWLPQPIGPAAYRTGGCAMSQDVCIGHASELSTSEWKPDPACPLHGTGQQPAQPESGEVKALSLNDLDDIEEGILRDSKDNPGGTKRALIASCRTLRIALTAAQQRIAALHAALRTYGWHKPECDYMQEELPCTCGFLTAVERDFQENSNG